ncbi:DNA cytosine methyltransferase [Ilumatobacter sp.]|uniref:DNA cytosine methyltransferase n=1 Tax=Ilumatobacter sp. TaxID=1967498 RepID=UPI003752C36D
MDFRQTAMVIDVPRQDLTVIDLFAGCGGMTQGFVDAGFTPVMAIEMNPHAAATYAANFDPDLTHTLCADISEVATADIPAADVVIGGPPCQGFSALGRQKKDDPRNKLWMEYVRVVRAAQPEFFVLENVDRFMASGEFELLSHEVDKGLLKDYEIRTAVLNAADYGAPQRRKRTIVIGSRRGQPTMPNPTHGRKATLDRAPWTTLATALDGIPFRARSSGPLPSNDMNIFDQKIAGPFTMEELHFGRNATQLSRDRYEVIPPGGGRFDLGRERPDLLPPCWRNKPTGTSDVMGRLEWDKPSVTIRTEFFKPEKGRYLHPQWEQARRSEQVNRVITHREAATIQTFPDHFLWCGTKTEIARQIGNAVPPVLARALAEHIANELVGTIPKSLSA